MANANMSPADVKAICDKLECSPHANFSDSPHGGQSNIVPSALPGNIAGSYATQDTLGLNDRKGGVRPPGLKKGFRKRAPVKA